MPVSQRVVPMVDYEDAGAAIEFLTRAFGFVENRDHRYTEPDGRISHAEVVLDGGLVMLGQVGGGYQSPDHHEQVCEHARRWLETRYIVDGVLVYVNDVDAHHAQAVAEGARVLTPPEGGMPGRRYRVADCEGHRWMFLQLPD